MFIKIGVVSNNGNFRFRWYKAGSPGVEYSQNFPNAVSTNGTVSVIEINLENNSNWNNQDIMQFWIEHSESSNASSNDRWHIDWVAWKNLDL